MKVYIIVKPNGKLLKESARSNETDCISYLFRKYPESDFGWDEWQLIGYKCEKFKVQYKKVLN